MFNADSLKVVLFVVSANAALIIVISMGARRGDWTRNSNCSSHYNCSKCSSNTIATAVC